MIKSKLATKNKFKIVNFNKLTNGHLLNSECAHLLTETGQRWFFCHNAALRWKVYEQRQVTNSQNLKEA